MTVETRTTAQDWLGADIEHLVAVAAFDRPVEAGGLVAIDEAARRLAQVKRQLDRAVDDDLAAVGGPLQGLGDRLLGSGVAECRLLGLLAFREVRCGGSAARAAGLAMRALAGGHLLAESVRSPALLAAGMALGAAGRTDQAEWLFGTVAERARWSDSVAVRAAALGQRGVERFRRGALDGALADLMAAVGVARGQQWETMVDDGRAQLLRVRVERGELMLAERDLYEWCASGPLPDTAFGNRLLIERGRLRLVQDRLGDAMVDLRAAARRLGGSGESVLFEWRGAAALAHHRLGEQQAALALAREDLELARGWGAPRQLGSALVTLGLIEGGSEGVERGREACKLLERSAALLERARAMISLGLLLRRAGEPVRARSQLLAGGQLAKRCGAHALAAQAEQEIAASGRTRRRRTLLSGPEALTPTEQRIARLAANGLSNPDIARSLYITRKTVEMHLGNTYRKLRIHSRQQLQTALREPTAGIAACSDRRETRLFGPQRVTSASTSLGAPGSRPAAASLAICTRER
jgi:DNA-binding CsgD family transcriptional regulator